MLTRASARGGVTSRECPVFVPAERKARTTRARSARQRTHKNTRREVNRRGDHRGKSDWATEWKKEKTTTTSNQSHYAAEIDSATLSSCFHLLFVRRREFLCSVIFFAHTVQVLVCTIGYFWIVVLGWGFCFTVYLDVTTLHLYNKFQRISQDFLEILGMYIFIVTASLQSDASRMAHLF